ncbi:MAG: DUF2971 domain-containing protein [Alphaproteobacteria bacterium]
MADIHIYAKPPSLYRYRPLGEKAERELKAMVEGYIHCSPYSKLNDPMEGKHRLSLRFQKNPNHEKRQVQIRRAFNAMGIASFSETYDHEPMWAHYADFFEGMCVEYNLKRLITGLDSSVAITRMMYSEKEPVLLNDGSSALDRARLCLSSKTVRWASEREWRIFIEENGQARYQKLRTVTKIFLGSRVSEQDQARVCVAARRLNIPVSKMVVDAYSLNFKTLQAAVRRKPK